MILPLRRKHRITARSTPRATADSHARTVGAWGAALALALSLAATPPLRADFKPSTGKAESADTSSSSDSSTKQTADGKSAARSSSSAKNLKWRTPKVDASQPIEKADAAAVPSRVESDKKTSVAHETSIDRKQIEEQQPVDTQQSSGKSVIKISLGKPTAPAKPESQANSESQVKSASDEPVEFKSVPKARAIKTARSRARLGIERLADASPSPHSSAALDSDTSSLKILKTSNEEPKLDPFGDELPTPPVVKSKKRERTVQAALQEKRGSSAQDPFADEPRLEQVMPPSQAPERLPEDEMTQVPYSLPTTCPTPKEYVKKLADISTNIAAEPGEFPVECGLGDEQFVPRDWQSMIFAWKASALCHKPLYFEDIELERYGQTPSPLFQPLLSAARFYLTLPILPYKMGLEPPCECIYPLGYYRPGSCAPFIIPPVPISLRGALLEAGVWVAGVALVP